MKKFKQLVFSVMLLFVASFGFSQVTSSAITGTVKDNKGLTVPGASVEVIHKPSGTKYFATTGMTGNFGVPAIRPGGPYTVKVSFINYKTSVIDDVTAPLGNAVNLNVTLAEESSVLSEVVVKTTIKNNIISKNRTGASQSFSNRELNAVPIIGSRSIKSITKYNANGDGSNFGGQDARLNNFTIDGSVFNNGFGLGNDSQAGGRTGSTAISLDAIEQLQVNIAPFDVRQSGFLGAGVNAVTRSGTNEFQGSVYTSNRNNSASYLGNKAGDLIVNSSPFTESIFGARIGAPIIKNKLFIFANFEKIDNVSPATPWTTTGSPNGGSQVTAANYSDLTTVSALANQLGYQTGPFERYDAISKSFKYLIRLDWNINDNNKLSVRYVNHDSQSDQLISNSGTLIGGRSSSATAIAFKNSGYVIFDNTRSIVAELNTKFTNTLHNNLIVGYDKQIEDRDKQGALFPTIDIRIKTADPLNPLSTALATPYNISLGLDPFTNENKLDYSTLHVTDNITKYLDKHTIVGGLNFERFVSNNSFFPQSNGNYSFDSLKDFQDTVNAYVAANPNGSTSPVVPVVSPGNTPVRFQYRYSALEGGAVPLQVLKSNRVDAYLQDEWKVMDNLKLTYGLRVSTIAFENTALQNTTIANYTFANGDKFNTNKMPNTQVLFEPRIGFNLDVMDDRKTQLRGGSGIFTGKPPYVFISNQIGNNGILTGYINQNSTPTSAIFSTDPSQFTPANATTAAPSSYDLAFTNPNYKFPQVWKSTIAIDQKLPFGFIGTIEGIYAKNINAIYYTDANLENATRTYNGPDGRPIFGGTSNSNATTGYDLGSAGNVVNFAGLTINDNVTRAAVLQNTNLGYFYSTTFKLEYPIQRGLWGSIAYTKGEAKDLMSSGSIAASSFTGARSVNGNNDLRLSLSDNDIPHRIVGILGYRFEYGKKVGGATSINLGFIAEQKNRFSYVYNGDLNRDGIAGNDLLFVPQSGSDIRFVPNVVTAQGFPNVTYSEAQQQQAFDDYISQDAYLSTRRGQYAERNGNVLPFVSRLDLSVTQDIYFKVAGKKNSFQIRADILNFTNMLNKDWGVSQRATATQLLAYQGTIAGVPYYKLATQTLDNGSRILAKDTFQKNSSVFDVWQAQLSLRYSFN